MGSVGPVKVEGAELLTVELPLVTPFRTSYATTVVERKLLVRLGTDAGTGWGECGAPAEPLYTSEYGDAACHVLVHHLLPRLATSSGVTSPASASLGSRWWTRTWWAASPYSLV